MVRGTDAEQHVIKRFKTKRVRLMKSHLRPTSIAGFLRSMPLVFNRHKSKGINRTYHFAFTGQEAVNATVIIKDKTVSVLEGHQAEADLKITVDSSAWLSFLRKDKALPLLLISRKIRIKGPIAHMKEFSRCFR